MTARGSFRSLLLDDLSGLKVGHSAEDFEVGEDVVLTLKDSRVLGGEGMIILPSEYE